MATTSIQWTDRVWNPTTGCDKVSPGCAHCYAETIALRFWAKQYPQIRSVEPNRCGTLIATDRPRVFEDVQTHEDRLLEPLSWRKPARVFVNSMSDLFHEDVSDEFIDRVFAVMALAEQHTFQVLTKRPERMRAYCAALQDRAVPASLAITRTPWWDGPQSSPCAVGAIEDRIGAGPLPNVWLGVSVENQHFADERIPLLLQTPAAVRFISAEPLLGSVDVAFWLKRPYQVDDSVHPSLNWVIVGGESGPGARPFNIDWGRSIIRQCKVAGVPVFVKQVGSRPEGWWTNALGPYFNRHALKDRKGGTMEEWPADLRVRQFPEVSCRG